MLMQLTSPSSLLIPHFGEHNTNPQLQQYSDQEVTRRRHCPLLEPFGNLQSSLLDNYCTHTECCSYQAIKLPVLTDLHVKPGQTVPIQTVPRSKCAWRSKPPRTPTWGRTPSKRWSSLWPTSTTLPQPTLRTAQYHPAAAAALWTRRYSALSATYMPTATRPLLHVYCYKATTWFLLLGYCYKAISIRLSEQSVLNLVSLAIIACLLLQGY